MNYQIPYFPMNVINLTQGYGYSSSTHKLSYALDLAGKDSGKDEVYAPFDCKITKLYQPSNTTTHANTVWLTSTKEVKCANGYVGYLTMSITHPSEISKMKLGTEYKQGELICTEGQTGRAQGNHIHLELAEGKDAGWTNKSKGSYSEYVIINKIKPEEYLYIKKDSVVKNDTYKGTKYTFIVEPEQPKYEKGTYVTLANMNVRTGAGTNFAIKKVKDLTTDGKKNATSNDPNHNAVYKEGTKFTAQEIIYLDNNQVWAKTPSGYVCIQGSEDKIYCNKI